MSSIYPEKLVFENSEYRTPKTLNFIRLLCRIGKGLEQKKEGKKSEFSESSLRVDFTDKISNQLLKDIDKLSSLKRYISSH